MSTDNAVYRIIVSKKESNTTEPFVSNISRDITTALQYIPTFLHSIKSQMDGDKSIIGMYKIEIVECIETEIRTTIYVVEPQLPIDGL